MIHIYTGNGKGKTTAVVGLAVRAAGRGQRVVFAQFLKSAETGELEPLSRLGISVIRSKRSMGFTFAMNEAEKAACREEQRRLLDAALAAAASEQKAGLVVLDEVLDAVSTGMLEAGRLAAFLRALPADCEAALTGRPVPGWLAEMADYHSDIRKVKHPFDRGVPARAGIEK
jgi:cob(I)alamin adenosyltransferase